MSKYKKIIYFWLVSIFISILFHVIIYFTYVKKVYDDNIIVGDIARMSYSVDLVDKKRSVINFDKKHIDFANYNGQKVELITIGDSFSQGCGLDNYYQDNIVKNYNNDVLNIQMLKNTANYIETIALLNNSGELDKMGVKYVLIESVQRRALERFATNIDFSKIDSSDFSKVVNENLKNNSAKVVENRAKNKINIEENLNYIDDVKKLFSSSTTIKPINNLNLNAFIYNLRFELKGYGKITPHVYREKLSKELFSTDIGNNLLFYDEDIIYLKLESIENIKLMNDNLNKLAKILSEKNIKLIFMPAVDKYNLYRDYIISNEYKESIFFEELEKLQKDYIFINTKSILKQKLNTGEKDLYYVDDTHWSFKASDTVINDKSFRKIFE